MALFDKIKDIFSKPEEIKGPIYVEMDSKVTCECGNIFYDVYSKSVPLQQTEKYTGVCPFCGEEYTIEYQFKLHEHCLENKGIHFIPQHFSKNEGTFEPQLYPRKCYCGEEMILEQKRVM